MTNSTEYTREDYLACGWKYDVSAEDHCGYYSVMQSLQKCAQVKRDAGHENLALTLELLGRASSMMLVPDSINEPFNPILHDFQAGRRSAIPEDFTSEELIFFESILDDADEPWLKARLADLLWLCKKPKNPTHARIAIESYIAHPIAHDTWRLDIDGYWERAARIAMQIKDFEKLEEIKSQLFATFGMEYPSCTFMSLWLANLLDKLKVDHDFREDLAPRLFQLGSDLKNSGDFNAARSYFKLAAKKYQQCNDDHGWLESLVSIADSFEQEANSRSSDSNMVANSFYQNAIQAYRCIPTRYRDAYDIDDKMQSIRVKITDTGKASLDEMGLVQIPGIDLSNAAKASIAHVIGKRSLEEALMYFSGLYPGPEFKKLAENARENMQKNPLQGLMGSSHMSSDGRVVAKTPSANLTAGEDDPANQAVLYRQIQQHFDMEIQYVVNGEIIHALRQILMEHRVTKDFLEAACHHSPIVPQDRAKLLGFALFLGFEHDFGNAIHLLCPQFEHIVRVQLKQAGAHTSNIDGEGIENENGLSTLMDLPEAIEIFGEDLVFEIKSVFTDTLGFNLRNEVAHGLLSDTTSSSTSSIYAWWMILRLVIRSIRNGGSFQEGGTPSSDTDQHQSA